MATVALQVYTVRDEMARDLERTLQAVAEMGYAAVEWSGGDRGSVESLQRLLERVGLRVISVHTMLSRNQSENERSIDFCLALGSRYLTIAALSPEDRGDVKALGPRMNEFGRRCLASGIKLCYHNHDFEFKQQVEVPGGVEGSGTCLLDRLLAVTDAELLALQLDVYWAAAAGVDPIAYLRRHSGRVPHIHVKDMAEDGGFAEVGDGTLPIREICEAASEGGAEYFIVENDEPRIPSLESARRSLENLQRMGLGTMHE
jgi:sugar phosphate isomerase/epimerase